MAISRSSCGGAIEEVEQAAPRRLVDGVGDRVRQRVGHQLAAQAEVAREPAQRQPVDQGHGQVGGDAQRDEQGNEKTELKTEGAHAVPGGVCRERAPGSRRSQGRWAAIGSTGTRTSPHCARCRSAWSITHQREHRLGDRRRADADAGVVAAEGLDRGRRALEVDRAARAADRAGRLDRDRHRDVLAGRDAAEHAAGVVAGEALRRQLVAVRRAALRDRREAGADLDALDRVDAHHRVRDVGVELVVERLAEADRHAAARPRRCARRSSRRPAQLRRCRPRCAAMSLALAAKNGLSADVLRGLRTGSRSRRSGSCGRRRSCRAARAATCARSPPAPTAGAVRRADERPPPRGSRRPYLWW